jgi:hypothetical protein
MTVKYKDFDQFFSEKKDEQKVLKFQGEVYHLPPSMPAAAMLMFKRFSKAGADKQVDEDDIIRLFCHIFGQKRFHKWSYQPAEGYTGLTLDQMLDLLGWATEAYGLASPSSDQVQDPNPEAAPAE